MQKQDSEKSVEKEEENEANLNEAELQSKKKLKKMLKKEKWEKEKLIKRKEKREKEKEKKKLKKLQQQTEPKEQREEVKPQDKITTQELTRRRKDDYVDKQKVGVKVVIDLQFYDLMTEKEANSLIKQLGYCHSVNRSSEKCFNYILTSATADRQKLFSDRYNADKWGINMEPASLMEVFPKEKLVYLTGDAEQDINEFDPEQKIGQQRLVYIIGGIVDHNRLKKITYNYAVEQGIAVRRLPMKNVQLKASVHLAVNHVWEWMLKKYNGATWDEAIKAVIPARKLENYTQE